MFDTNEAIAKIISSKKYYMTCVEYAVTCKLAERELRERATELFENDEYDVAGAAFQDMCLEAESRYKREMNDVFDAIMERHGDTLAALDITDVMVRNALRSYAIEVMGEMSERLQR